MIDEVLLLKCGVDLRRIDKICIDALDSSKIKEVVEKLDRILSKEREFDSEGQHWGDGGRIKIKRYDKART